MSRENVEIVRRAYEAFQAGGLDAARDFFDPEVVWEDLGALPGAATHRGHAGLEQAIGRFYEAWGDLSFTVDELIDAGDRVIVAHHWQGAGKASGTPIDTLTWNVLTLRDGKIAHRRAYRDRAAALAAAGGDD